MKAQTNGRLGCKKYSYNNDMLVSITSSCKDELPDERSPSYKIYSIKILPKSKSMGQHINRVQLHVAAFLTYTFYIIYIIGPHHQL